MQIATSSRGLAILRDVSYLLAVVAFHCANTMMMEFTSVALRFHTLVSIATSCRVYFRSFLSMVLLLTKRVPVLVVLLVVPVLVVVVVMVVVAMTVVIVVLMVGGSLVVELSLKFVALDFAV